jgi:hypothetical protein
MTLERLLARVYVDPIARAAFLADPAGEARRAGLPERVVAALASVDRAGIEMQAASFASKRSGRLSDGEI